MLPPSPRANRASATTPPARIAIPPWVRARPGNRSGGRGTAFAIRGRGLDGLRPPGAIWTPAIPAPPSACFPESWRRSRSPAAFFGEIALPPPMRRIMTPSRKWERADGVKDKFPPLEIEGAGLRPVTTPCRGSGPGLKTCVARLFCSLLTAGLFFFFSREGIRRLRAGAA